MSTAIILFAHGARDPSWAEPILRIKALVAERRSDAQVEAAFLERLDPSLGDAVRRLASMGADHIVVCPLFMAPSGHLRREVPELLRDIRAAHPDIEVELAPPMGDAAPILDAIAEWAAQQG
jgi:sirohydrochlorin cobaltochelatase